MKLGEILIVHYPMLHRKMVYKPYKTTGVLLFKIKIDSFIGIGINLGTHPCCYIASTAKEKALTEADIHDLPYQPHGCFTYAGKFEKKSYFTEEEAKLYWIGWDYAHYNDYNGSLQNTSLQQFNSQAKKYSTMHLIKDTEEIIKQYKK